MPREARSRPATLRRECRLREIRGERPLRELGKITGVAASKLSELERQTRLPEVHELDGLELGYGPRESWYVIHVEAA